MAPKMFLLCKQKLFDVWRFSWGFLFEIKKKKTERKVRLVVTGGFFVFKLNETIFKHDQIHDNQQNV